MKTTDEEVRKRRFETYVTGGKGWVPCAGLGSIQKGDIFRSYEPDTEELVSYAGHTSFVALDDPKHTFDTDTWSVTIDARGAQTDEE